MRLLFGMDSLKTVQTKTDSKSRTEICPTSKLLSKKNVEPANSKIPKRDDSSVTSKKPVRSTTTTTRPTTTRPGTTTLPKPTRLATSVRKPSNSMMDLNLSKSNLLPTSRSLNSQRSASNSKEQTPRRDPTTKIADIRKKAEKAEINRNLHSFEIAKEKLQSCQEQFMTKFNLVRDDLPKEEKDYKLVVLIKNNEGHLVAKTQTSKITVDLCDSKTLDQLKSSCRKFAQQSLESIEQCIKSPRTIGDTNENLKEVQEAKVKLISEKKAFLDILQQIENLQAVDKPKEPPGQDLEIKVKSLSEEVESKRKQLEETQSELSKTKKNLELKINTLKKELEEKSKNSSHKSHEYEELKKKNEILEKENVKTKAINKDVNEKLIKKIFELEESNEKLKNSANKNVIIESKNKELESEIVQLKLELTTALNMKKNSNNEQITELTLEINDLRSELAKLKEQKEALESDGLTLKNEMIKLKSIDSSFTELQGKMLESNKEKQELKTTLSELEAKLKASEEKAFESSDMHEEMKQIQAVNTTHLEKIKNLELELAKSQFQVKKLEERITNDGKLLKIRTELIESLQKKEHSQKIRLTDLFAEVGEKNNDLQMIKTEILTKTEEFQNLFATLSSKQIELTRQEHMIKLLQENNERAQQLRVRQEAKIGKLEEEILALKHTIAIYQDAVIPNNSLRRNLALVEASSRECDDTDSLGFYVEERRKKRHVDINVKKYEK